MNNHIIKTRLLVIGSNGMLGQRIVERYINDDSVEMKCASAEPESFIPGVNYSQIDISQKYQVRELILNFFPDFVINAAAYTNVDKSETEKETAWKINVNGAENIALYSWTIDAHMIHFSTDYVFDGKNGPYSEIDKPNPICYYGRTKLASENSVRVSGVRSTIIRTNILYGPVRNGRPDFVRWVVDSLTKEENIKIVTDQIGNPTFIDDLAEAVSSVIKFKKEGIFNIGGRNFISRYTFTELIAEFFNLDKKLITPILTSELYQPAPRPLKSGLLTLKAETELGYKPTDLTASFEIIRRRLSL